MKIKTSKLIGLALDWAVERAKGTHWSGNGYFVFKNANGTNRSFERNPEWRYSTDWSQGGPIIDRERIDPDPIEILEGDGLIKIWKATIDYGNHQDGPTLLIAAMRCYVASKLGDEIEIPEELTA